MDSKYRKNQKLFSSARALSGSVHPVKVSAVSGRIVSSASASAPSELVISTISGKRGVIVTYEVESIARRRANLQANRGPSRISTTASE